MLLIALRPQEDLDLFAEVDPDRVIAIEDRDETILVTYDVVLLRSVCELVLQKTGTCLLIIYHLIKVSRVKWRRFSLTLIWFFDEK